MLVGCVLCSLFFVYAGENTQHSFNLSAVKFVGVILLILYMIYNGFVIKFIYFKIEDNFDYYFYNVAAFILFLLTALVVKLTCAESIYMNLFSLTNVFYFISPRINGVVSIILFIISVLVTFYASEKYYAKRM